MIKFFRRIRKQLLGEGKIGNYLKYAIGEVVLVAIGILMALQINNWNEKRLNSILEQELMFNLISDIEVDIINLKYQDSVLALAFLAKTRLGSFIKGEDLSRDSVFYYLSKSGPTTTFNATTITYDEMKNADGFKVISSKEIRREIAILYKQYEIVKTKEILYFEAHARIRNIRIEDFATGSLSSIGSDEIRDPDQIINQVRTNRRFINALESNYVSNQYEAYKETLQKTIHFKEILAKYLNID